jgi:hypothetical protein
LCQSSGTSSAVRFRDAPQIKKRKRRRSAWNADERDGTKLKQINEKIMKIPMYMGRRIKDGSMVAGYPAIGSEGNTAWIMAPTDVSDDQFRMYNVDPESLERID